MASTTETVSERGTRTPLKSMDERQQDDWLLAAHNKYFNPEAQARRRENVRGSAKALAYIGVGIALYFATVPTLIVLGAVAVEETIRRKVVRRRNRAAESSGRRPR